LAAQELVIRSFTDKIETSLVNSDWDALKDILDSRFAFLQHLFSTSTPASYQQSLKRIAESILAEDAVFESRLEAEKHTIAQQHEAFERSRRALKAYGN
jgi:hypothetical protein